MSQDSRSPVWGLIGPLMAVLFLFSMTTRTQAQTPVPLLERTVVVGQFQQVYDALLATVLGHGLNTAGEIDLMQYVGESSQFVHARTLEFCSATLTHKLVRDNPQQLLSCPLAISVYELDSAPGHIYLQARAPFMPDSPSSLAEVEALLSSLIEQSTVWFAKPSH